MFARWLLLWGFMRDERAIERQSGRWKRRLMCGEMEQEIVAWGMIVQWCWRAGREKQSRLKGWCVERAIYRRMRVKALFPSTYSAPRAPGWRVWEGGQWLELRRENYRISVSSSHHIGDSSSLYFIFKAKWHFKLLAFTRENVSGTLQRADTFTTFHCDVSGCLWKATRIWKWQCLWAGL